MVGKLPTDWNADVSTNPIAAQYECDLVGDEKAPEFLTDMFAVGTLIVVMRYKVRVTNSWQLSRTCPMCIILALCICSIS